MNQSGDRASSETGQRILILTPWGRDASLADQTLGRSGLATCICGSLQELRREIDLGAGCALIAEEALPTALADSPEDWLGSEPSWSSLPVIILLGRGASLRNIPALRALETRPNVGFLERPVPKRTLISALRAALEARRLQYAVRDALEELRIANRRKDEFLAILSHELRNPLAPIRSAVYVLNRLEFGPPASHDRARALISMVERQVDHLVRLVDDLLEVSRITTGKITLARRRTDLKAIIRQAQEISQPLISAESHALAICLPDRPVFVDCDTVRLAQVFANLLNNAAKYSPSGGKIRLSLRAEGARAIVSVRDDGIGISPEMLPKVFDLFSQSHGGSGREQGGLGIGLALARSLVELHGGAIEAHSDGEHRGSEFIVRLPLADCGEEPAGAGPCAAEAADVKALVVDDDRDVADSFALLLKSMGVESRVAYGGQEALGAVSDFEPHVVFLDLGMPLMDGYETAKRIQAAPGGKDIVLVALSGWGRSEDRERTRTAGFSHHFVKPMDLAALRHLLAS
ncbi:ATP-binding protein [Methylocystis heyeri]|uniref:histidine kinase n=1 Tax=Methylocystis heyeri TaxID=391905 RepID=A0A6B8KG13_9HYPH|nr:ATP-binding protein [Methylocystis heyeri]QGM45468.1 response regulator [Methylocystis heyeri]